MRPDLDASLMFLNCAYEMIRDFEAGKFKESLDHLDKLQRIAASHMDLDESHQRVAQMLRDHFKKGKAEPKFTVGWDPGKDDGGQSVTWMVYFSPGGSVAEWPSKDKTPLNEILSKLGWSLPPTPEGVRTEWPLCSPNTSLGPEPNNKQCTNRDSRHQTGDCRTYKGPKTDWTMVACESCTIFYKLEGWTVLGGK